MTRDPDAPSRTIGPLLPLIALLAFMTLVALLVACGQEGDGDETTPTSPPIERGDRGATAAGPQDPDLDPADDGLYVVGGGGGATKVIENLGGFRGAEPVASGSLVELTDLRHPHLITGPRLLAPTEDDRGFRFVAGQPAEESAAPGPSEPTPLVVVEGDLDDPGALTEVATIDASSHLEMFWDADTPDALFGTRLTERGLLPGSSLNRFECFRVDSSSDEAVTLIDGYECRFHPSGHAVALEAPSEDQLVAVVADLDGARTEVPLPGGATIGDFGLTDDGSVLWITLELDQPSRMRTILLYDSETGELVHRGEPTAYGWEVQATSAGGVLVSGASPAGSGLGYRLISTDGTVTDLEVPAGSTLEDAWLAPDLSESVLLTTFSAGSFAKGLRLTAHGADGSQQALLHEEGGAERSDPEGDLWTARDDDPTIVLAVSGRGAPRAVLAGGTEGPLVDVGLDPSASVQDVAVDDATGDVVVTAGISLDGGGAGAALIPGDGEPVAIPFAGEGQDGPTLIDLADGEALLATLERELARFEVLGPEGVAEMGVAREGLGGSSGPPRTMLDEEGDILLVTGSGLLRCARTGCDELADVPDVALQWSRPPERGARWASIGGCDPDDVGTPAC